MKNPFKRINRLLSRDRKTDIYSNVYSINFHIRKLTPPVKIRLIGIPHGEMPIAPMGIRIGRIVKRELEKEKGLILAEGKDRGFIPKKYLKRTTAIEERGDEISTFILEKIPLSGKIKIVSSATMLGIFSYFKEFFVKANLIEGLAPRKVLTEDKIKNLIKFMRKFNITSEQVRDGLKLITTVRSLLMALAIIKEAKGNKSATVVVGSGHQADIHKFLTKPELAVRYIDAIETKLAKVEGTKFILYDLNKAREFFLQQYMLKKFNRKRINTVVPQYHWD